MLSDKQAKNDLEEMNAAASKIALSAKRDVHVLRVR